MIVHQCMNLYDIGQLWFVSGDNRGHSQPLWHKINGDVRADLWVVVQS